MSLVHLSVSYHITYVSHIKSENSFPERHITIKSILWETWEWSAGVKLQHGTAGAHWLDFSSFAFICLIPRFPIDLCAGYAVHLKAATISCFNNPLLCPFLPSIYWLIVFNLHLRQCSALNISKLMNINQ